MSKNTFNFQTVDSNQIYINSSNADLYLNGSMKSNITFFFNDVISTNKRMVEKRISIVNCQFPVSYYLINNTNNQIIINGVIKYFPIGNYNINNFITTWQSSFGSSWILTYNKIINKISISYPTSFTLSDNKFSFFNILGLVNGTTYTSTYNGTNYILNCIYCIDFSGIACIDIKTSTFNLNNTDSYHNGRTNTIASIPVNSKNIINYNNFTQYNSLFKNTHLEELNLMIQDENDNFIDFNNLNWSITFQIDIIYEHIEDIDTLDDVYNNLKKKIDKLN